MIKLSNCTCINKIVLVLILCYDIERFLTIWSVLHFSNFLKNTTSITTIERFLMIWSVLHFSNFLKNTASISTIYLKLFLFSRLQLTKQKKFFSFNSLSDFEIMNKFLNMYLLSEIIFSKTIQFNIHWNI